MLANAAASEELLTSEPAGVVRCQEYGDGGDITDFATPAKWSLLDGFLLEVRANEPGTVGI